MFYLRVLIRNHQFKAIHGDIRGTILKFGDESMNEWNLCQMEHVLYSMDLSSPVSENFWQMENALNLQRRFSENGNFFITIS